MRRIVSVWLPHLPIDRIRRSNPAAIDDETPHALVASEARGQVITAVNGRAWRDGIRPGMALADARAMLPALRSRPAEGAHDAALLEALACWAGRYGPNRNSDGPDGLWIDITGVAHLFAHVAGIGIGIGTAAATDDGDSEGEAELLADLVRRLGAAGFSSRAGLADTLGAAHALARHATATSPIAIAAPGRIKDALANLSVEALRLTPASVLLLQRLGLTRIGDLYGLPRAALERRFRDATLAARVLTRLDQALGISTEPCRPLTEPPAFTARRTYAEPLIVSPSIEAEVAALAVELAQRLEAGGLGLRRLLLSLHRTDASVATIDAGTSSPCRDPDHLLDLVSLKLAGIDAGFGIDALVLDATLLEPLDAAQPGLHGAAAFKAGAAAVLIDRLSNRLGTGKVLRLEPRTSHLPERAATTVPTLLAGDKAGTPAPSTQSAASPQARPPFLLARPEPIEVIAEIPEGAPARFTWRRVSHGVLKAEGPERIAPEWWRSIGAAPRPRSSAARDYYRIEDTAGGRYWVFRLGLYGRECEEESEDTENTHPGWYMHGLFP